MAKILRMSKEATVEAVRGGRVTICVVGLGYIGLPLAVLFVQEGARVKGCVRTETSAERVNRGETHVTEHDVSALLDEGAHLLEGSCPNCGVRLFELETEAFCPCCGRLAAVTKFGVHLQDKVAEAHARLARARQSLQDLLKAALKTGRLSASTQTAQATRQSDVVLITVGTPIDNRNIPNYADLLSASKNVGQGLQKDTLVILKSTVSPGTTENLVRSALEEESQLKSGNDFGLAFMPETIKEGHALYEFRNLPRIVGGITTRDATAAANLFSVFKGPVYVYDQAATIEASKLFMNIYRDVNIALANEFALACEKMGVDALQAINAANIDPKTHILTPGLVGGYCLPKDTYHFTHSSERVGYSPQLMTLARQLNSGMPSHILDLTEEVLAEINVNLRGASVALLGLGFKANSGDLRNTPAKPIYEGLLKRGVNVKAQDPFAQNDQVNQVFQGINRVGSVEEAVREVSCTIIVTDHLEYRRLTAKKLKRLMAAPCAIVDARHIIDPEEAHAAGVHVRSLGKPTRNPSSNE